MLAGILVGVAVIGQAMLLAWIVHRAVTGAPSIADLLPAALALVAVVLTRGAAQCVQGRAASTAATDRCRAIRDDLLDRLHAAGPARLDGWHRADLASRALHAVDALTPYIAHYLPQRILALVVPALIGVTALLHDWLAGLLLLLSAPLIPLFMALVGWGAARLSARFETRRARAAAVFADHVRGLLSIRLFNAEREATVRVRGFAEQLRDDAMRVLRVAFLSSAVLEFFAAVAVAAVAIYVGMGLLGYLAFGPADDLTVYRGLCVLLLAPEFFVPLRQLATHYHDRAAALGAAEQLAPLFALPAMPDATDAHARDPGNVILQAIRVARDDRTILQAFSLDVRPGELVLLWGPSGCGKTTVLHTIAGHLPVDAGEVRVNGEAPGIPGAVAWLGQRPFLAHGSIARNIALGRDDADRAAIAEAARNCGVLSFAEALPDGLDTRLGERGLGLSGGQAQRVALARAWLSQAPVVLLDEPTTGLDADAAAPVHAAMRRLCADGRSLVVAGHDPALRGIADTVIDMAEPS